MLRSKLVSVALGCCISLSALACGPDFPNALLSDRVATLEGLPDGIFINEVRTLLPQRNDALVTHEEPQWAFRDEADDAKRREQLRAEGTPEASLYADAADAFHEGEFAQASQKFAEVLALPANERRTHGLAALYSKARADSLLGDHALAVAGFAKVREEVLAGAPDPLGLGVASFGEQAGALWQDEKYTEAVQLYAEQAARGSTSGSSSLLIVARRLTSVEGLLEQTIHDPLVQRLIATYLYTRAEELGEQGINDLIAVLEAQGVDKVDGADRLAAAAYRMARYELAAKLAPRSDSALAWWVRAKLALREGNEVAAADAYAKSAKAFPRDQSENNALVDNATQCRIEAESGVLALSRGEYLSAMQHLYDAGEEYWEDLAYIADRVLSVEELRGFVDRYVPLATPALVVPSFEDWTPISSSIQLRNLLARRLMRSGDYAQAIDYFSEPAIREQANAYAAARAGMNSGGQIERAQSAFTAGQIARAQGMELIGYEFDPDYQVYGGSFDPGERGSWNGEEWVVEPRSDLSLPNRFVAKDEASRLTATRADPLQRFHYRYLAANLAEQAADNLPNRSQAYAAVLCAATGWVIDTDSTRATALWRRYVKNGPYVPWAEDFGRQCEAPNFVSAKQRLRYEQVVAIKRWARAALPYVAGGGVLLLLAFGVWIARRQRAKRSTAA